MSYELFILFVTKILFCKIYLQLDHEFINLILESINREAGL